MKIVYATTTDNLSCPACKRSGPRQFSTKEKTDEVEIGDGLIVNCNDCGYSFIVVNAVGTERLQEEEAGSERQSLRRIAEALEGLLAVYGEMGGR